MKDGFHFVIHLYVLVQLLKQNEAGILASGHVKAFVHPAPFPWPGVAEHSVSHSVLSPLSRSRN